MVLRKPTPFDRYAEAESTGTYNPEFDIDYVRNKIPYLQKSGAEWLIDRLGRANTRRREFLSYREKHRKKLAYPPPQLDDSTHCISTIHTAPSSFTTASAFVESYRRPDVEDRHMETQSITSYATSNVTDLEGKLRIPHQPTESSDGKPFECPYCYTIQVISGEASWR